MFMKKNLTVNLKLLMALIHTVYLHNERLLIDIKQNNIIKKLIQSS